MNLYVKNLPDEMDDDKLREEFSVCGTITSARVSIGSSSGPGVEGLVKASRASLGSVQMQHSIATSGRQQLGADVSFTTRQCGVDSVSMATSVVQQQKGAGDTYTA
jgi:RNA recognition motif-containing protein